MSVQHRHTLREPIIVTELGQPNISMGHSGDFAAERASLEPLPRLAAPWMQSRLLHRLFGSSRLFRRLFLGAACQMELALLGGHKHAGTLGLIRSVRRQRESLMGANEAFLVHSLAAAQGRLDGAMAEVGVYQGCSAKLISIASSGRPLHLFDTFAGLPEPLAQEQTHLHRRQYHGSLEAVENFLAGHRNIKVHPGEFPATASACEGLKFSFVHLDVDLETSMRACLEFFYPRMIPGGIILTHDYSWLAGVKRACDTFLAHRREQMIEMPTSQAMLVKL